MVEQKKKSLIKAPDISNLTMGDTQNKSQMLPEKLRISKDRLLNKQLPLKDKLILALSLLSDCKFVVLEKNYELKLNQIKNKVNILDKFENTKLFVLLSFLQEFFEVNIQQSLLEPFQFNNQRLLLKEQDKRTDCLQQLQLIVVVCYAKLITPNSLFQQSKAAGSTQDESSQELMSQEYKIEKLKLTSYLLTLLINDPIVKPSQAVIDVALYFTEQQAKEVSLFIQSTRHKSSNLNEDCLKDNEIQKGFIEIFIISVLALCVSLLKFNAEESNINSLAKIFEQIFKMIEKMHCVFYNQEIDLDDNNFLLGFIFRDQLIQVHTGTYYTKSNLLNITLIVALKFMQKIHINKIKQGFSQPLIEYFDVLDREILKQIDRVYLRQIRLYQVSEKYKTEIGQNQNFQVIEETKEENDSGSSVDDIQLSLPSNEIQNKESEIKTVKFVLDDSLTFQSHKIVLDKVWSQPVISSQSLDESKFYLCEELQQQTWVRVNLALIDLSVNIMPRYYEKSGNSKNINNPESFAGHMCDLIRVQILFVMRFNLFQPYLQNFARQLSVIPEHIGYDCILVLTIRKFFDAMNSQFTCLDFNSEILKQVYQTFDMISADHFKEADKNNYLRVQFMLFMFTKLEGINISEVLSNQHSLKQVFDSLFVLFKIDFSVDSKQNHQTESKKPTATTNFYPEKYTQIFEKMFDLDQVQDIIILREIIAQSEFKNIEDLRVRNDLAVSFMNKIIVQQLAINLIVQSATNSPQFFELAMSRILSEIELFGLSQCDPNGVNYIERRQFYNIPQSDHQISTLEYVISKVQFSSRLYQSLKLVLGLISRSLITNPKVKIYDILVSSDGSFDNQEFYYQPQQKNYFKDDFLISDFQPIKLNQSLRPESLTKLFSFLLDNCKVLSQSLDAQEQLTLQTYSPAVLKQFMTKSPIEIKSYFSKLKMNQIDRQQPQNKRFDNQNVGFKIVEKVCSMIMRFLIFTSQDVSLSANLVQAMTGKRPNTIIDSQSQFIPASEIQIPNFSQQMSVDSIVNTNIKEILNPEFRLLILRNILFTTDPYYESANLFFEQMRETLKSIKQAFTFHKDQQTEYHKLMKKLNPNYKQKNGESDTQVSQFRSGRDRSQSNQLLDLDQMLQTQRLQFKKYAEICVSVVSLYVKIQKQTDENLKLFERKSFLESVLLMIQTYVVYEKSFNSELISAALSVFTHRSREDSNPLFRSREDSNQAKQSKAIQISLQMLSNQNLANPVGIIYERHFDFILSSIIDYIQVVQPDPDLKFISEPEQTNIEQLTKLFQSIKLVFETLNNQIVVKEGEKVHEKLTADLIKLQRSIRPESINQLKKIFIFLKERSKDLIPGVDILYIIKQLSQMIVRLFGMAPKADHLRDFFSFFREILYYQDQMDEIDVSLLEEVLVILNSSINLRQGNQIQYASNKKIPRNEQIDHFVFSKITQGVLLFNNIDLPKELQICMMFKFSHESLVINQEQSKRQLSMIVLSLQDKSLTQNNQQAIQSDGRINLDIELVVDLEKRCFVLKDPNPQSYSNSSDKKQQLQFKPIQIQPRWYMLIIRITKKRAVLQETEQISIEASIDKFSAESKVVYQLFKADIKSKFQLALGNSVDACIDFKRSQQKYFRGRCSIPMFFTGMPDYKNSHDQGQRILIAALMDCLNSKQIINIKGIEINEQLQKMFEIDIGGKNKKEWCIPYLESYEQLIQPAIIAHQVLNKHGYICAVHCKRTSDVFIGIGGFKNMYPIIGKIIQSNIIQLGREKPGQIFSFVFKILSTLINLEPEHIENLMKKRNLMGLLRYCLLKIGLNQMITSDLLQDVKNIVRNNIFIQAGMPYASNQQQKLIQNCSHYIQKSDNFFKEFLNDFFHNIILDINILSLACYIIPKNNHDISQTTLSSISANNHQTRIVLVFNEFVELIHKVCLPIQNSEQASHFNQNYEESKQQNNSEFNSQQEIDTNQSVNQFSGRYCDFQELNSIIVNKITVNKLIEIVEKHPFNQLQNITYLNQIGESIASCIIKLDDKESFELIFRRAFNKLQQTERVSLLIYLKIILKVICDQSYKDKKEIRTVLDKKDDSIIKTMSVLLFQFEMNPKEKITEEIQNLKDEIISLTLLLMLQVYWNNRKNQAKKLEVEKVAAFDSFKQKFLNTINESLNKNSQLLTMTYQTLMFIAFGKKNVQQFNIPSAQQVHETIKNCEFSSKQKPVTEIHDFDIDFFFIVLDNLNKYTINTKVLFLNQYHKFILTHQDSFLKIFQGQTTAEKGNPFNDRLNEFYLKIVRQVFDSESLAIVEATQELIVMVCTHQLTKSLDEFKSKNLTENDDWNLQLFRRIIVYFESKPDLQLRMLQRIIKKILIEINHRQKPYNSQEQLKLNLKIIYLLQFIEEIYIKSRKELNKLILFQETIMLVMFLFEQLGILTLDTPDRISYEVDGFQQSQQQVQYPAKKQVNKQQNLVMSDLMMSIDDPFYAQLQLSKNQKFQKELSAISNYSQRNDQNERKKIKTTENFISGGPCRIFMHILLNSLSYQCILNNSQMFNNSIEMLRYLILRQRGSFFVKTINNIFGDTFETQQVKVYNLFDRPQYLKEIERLRYQKVKQVEEPVQKYYNQTSQQSQNLKSRHVDQQQPIHDFIKCEMKIFKLTVEGILNTTSRKLNDEKLNEERQSIDYLKEHPSQRDFDIAELGYVNIDQYNKIGFTTLNGFLIIQIIGETIELLYQTVICNFEDFDKRMFQDNLHESGQVDISIEKLQLFADENLIEKQLNNVVADESKQKIISILFLFLFDCLKAEFCSNRINDQSSTDSVQNQQENFNKIQSYKIYSKIIDSLARSSKLDSDDFKSNVMFISQFLDSSLNDQNYENSQYTETQNDQSAFIKIAPEINVNLNFFDNVPAKQNQAIQLMNNFGYANENMLKQQSKIQSEKRIQEQYKTPIKNNEESKDFQEPPKFSKQQTTKNQTNKKLEQVLSPKLQRYVSTDLSKPQVVEVQEQELIFQSLEKTDDNDSQPQNQSSSQQQTEDRQSWVDSIKSPISKNQKQSSSEYYQQTSNLDYQKEIEAQYQKQIIDFVRKLYEALNRFSVAQNSAEKQDIMTQILKQILFKEKQQKIYISFAQATSDYFQIELNQAKLNSDKTMENINHDVNRILKARSEQMILNQDNNENHKPISGFFQKAQENPMMQSMTLQSSKAAPIEIGVNSPTIFNIDPKSQNDKTSKTQNMNLNKLNRSLQGHDDINQMKIWQEHDTFLKQSVHEIKYTMDYQHTKYMFKKIVKRLSEDESSLWYDHVEEIQAEFKEIKDVYDSIQACLDPNIETAERRQERFKQILSSYDVQNMTHTVVKDIERILDYSVLVNNPKQKCYFVSQRRNIDSWGRMMLLKPNRKSLDYKAWRYFDYYVYDFLNKIFAVSMLNDNDFSDLIKPTVLNKQQFNMNDGMITLGQAKKVLQNPEFTNNLMSIMEESKKREAESDNSNQQVEQVEQDSNVKSNASNYDNSDEEFEDNQIQENVLNDQINSTQTLAYSVYLQKVRQDLLQRLDRNKLLVKVLTNEQSLKYDGSEDPQLIYKREEKIKAIYEKESQKNGAKVFQCQNIKIQGNRWGSILITKDFFYFLSACTSTPELPHLRFTDRDKNLKDKKELILTWEQVDEVMKRKVLNIFQGVDITTFEKKNYTFNLCSESKCDEFLHAVKKFLQNKKEEETYTIIDNPKTRLEEQEVLILNEWKNGLRTNMEFLMLINKYSGRTFNDPLQYPVFPWVLKDYSSQAVVFYELLKKNECYRDLTLHTGNISEEKVQMAKDTQIQSEQDKDDQMNIEQNGKGLFNQKFGYSSGQLVSQWNCRLEPFTSLNIIQSDYKRDERLQIDFAITQRDVFENSQSYTELLPEHFYLPEVMMNLNKVSLGQQDKKQLDSMFLPPWSMNYYDFIRIMRESLESKHVTKNIGHWIDLIFGINQKSISKLNLYFPCMYEDYYTAEKIKKDEEIIKKLNYNLSCSTEGLNITPTQIGKMLYFISPSQIFTKSVVQQIENKPNSEKIGNPNEEHKDFNQLIKAFIDNYKQRRRLHLGQISVHNKLNTENNIIHMIFNDNKKCLVFVWEENQYERRQNSANGDIFVYLCSETISKENLTESKGFDLSLKYEWISEDLSNIFQTCSLFQLNRLFVCGYLDNSFRIFDLDTKPGSGQHLIKKVYGQHNARLTCIKLTQDFKYLLTCDADGVIIHYGLQNKQVAKETKEAFPYKQLYKIQDQMDEILAIDTNATLDMYVTLSRDGTVAVRCQRTSKLWCHFKIFSKTLKQKDKEIIITGYTKTFRHIYALRLSLHGYIVIVGQPEQQQNWAKYLVYNLSGDVLLREYQEKAKIRGVFLNATEDQLIIAQNLQLNNVTQGNIRVVKLYGLERIANLSQLVYQDTLQQIQQQKNSQPQNNQNQNLEAKNQPKYDKTPMISVIALKQGEASLNIFFEGVKEGSTPALKEIICFETSKLSVWSQLKDMALAPRTEGHYM